MKRIIIFITLLLLLGSCAAKRKITTSQHFVDSVQVVKEKKSEVVDNTVTDTFNKVEEDVFIVVQEEIKEMYPDSTFVEVKRTINISKEKRDTTSQVIKSDLRAISDDLTVSNEKVVSEYHSEDKVSKKGCNWFFVGVTVGIATIVLLVGLFFYFKKKLFFL